MRGRRSAVVWCGAILVACGGRVGESSDGSSNTVAPDKTATSSPPAPATSSSLPPPPTTTTTTATFTLFGGSDGWSHYLGDTWEWREKTGWAQKATTGPDARSSAVMASLDGKTFLFGGITNGPLGTAGRGDTWEWNGATWTEHVTTGPGPRWNSKAATLGHKVVLFGGYGPGPGANGKTGYLGDTWEWDGRTWTERKVEGPPARTVHAMAAFGDKILLYGGQGEAGMLNDTWEWDGNTWTKHDVAQPPEARNGAALATLDDKPVLFGGGVLGKVLDQTWEWTGSTWTERAVSGPSGRASAAMAAGVNALVLFGGNTVADGSKYVYFADTWAWDGSAWTLRRDSGPGGRTGAAMSALVSKE